jgi:hypothetical protein
MKNIVASHERQCDLYLTSMLVNQCCSDTDIHVCRLILEFPLKLPKRRSMSIHFKFFFCIQSLVPPTWYIFLNQSFSRPGAFLPPFSVYHPATNRMILRHPPFVNRPLVWHLCCYPRGLVKPGLFLSNATLVH